jgi:large subunit ribosomal protein L13
MEYKIDAANKPMGRVATEVATIVLGKNDPNYAPNVVTKNTVVVKNINKAATSDRKLLSNKHYTHSGYLGSLKSKSYKEMFEEEPKDLFMLILKRMLPDNRLRDSRLKRVKFE